MRPDGSDVRAVTRGGDYEFTPTSAPDGSLIAFAGLLRGTFVQSALHVVGSDGRGRRRLTTPPPGTDDYDPEWSPEGGVIVFVRSHASEGLRQSDLYAARPDGTDVRQLTAIPGEVRGPSWSPDGSQIAFGRLSGHHGVVAVVNADGSGYRELTNAWGSPLPAWSPDGARIAFVNPRRAGLIVYKLATGSAVELAAEADSQSAPAWSPDGSHVVYLGTDGELHLIDVAAGTNARLTVELGLDRDPGWSHAAP
jgi:Tol biopolymer transport system component